MMSLIVLLMGCVFALLVNGKKNYVDCHVKRWGNLEENQVTVWVTCSGTRFLVKLGVCDIDSLLI